MKPARLSSQSCRAPRTLALATTSASHPKVAKLVRDAQAHLRHSTSAASSGGGTQRIARTLRARRLHEQLRLAYTCTRGSGRRWRMAADSLLRTQSREGALLGHRQLL